MVSKKFLPGILVIALVFGMMAVGCDNGTKDSETWSNVTGMNQLNGTWKGSYNESTSMQNFLELTNSEWTSGGYSTVFGNDMKVTAKYEITQTFDSAANTLKGTVKTNVSFTGSKVSSSWATIKAYMAAAGLTGVTYDNANYSFSFNQNLTFTASEINQLVATIKINQNGTKIKVPADDGVPEIIMTKQ